MDVGGGIWRTRRFTLKHPDFLQRSRHLAEWRATIAGLFSKIDPILGAEVAESGNPRLVVVVPRPLCPWDPNLCGPARQ